MSFDFCFTLIIGTVVSIIVVILMGKGDDHD